MTTIREQMKRARRRKRKRRPMFRCGSCGRGHGNPFGHRCTAGGNLKRKRAAAAAKAERDEQRGREREIRATERAAAKAKVADVRGVERARAAERIAAAKAKAPRPPAGRGRGPAHDWVLCRDADCERAVCEAYREGVDDGRELEHQPAYDDGWMAGRAAAGTATS